MENNFKTLIDNVNKFNSNESLKLSSNYLRGSIAKGLKDKTTNSILMEDTLLLKFHGIYQQDNRDLRSSRHNRFLEPNYQFMVRLRIPGGLLTVGQWIGLDSISRKFADRGIKITTRQTIQLHGVRKAKLKACMQAIKNLGLDTIAACGDDARGVVCGFNPSLERISSEVQQIARATSNRLIPKTSAYDEIWYETSESEKQSNEEPIYSPLYLPRKFKVGFAIPPSNDIDVYAQDVGFISIISENKLIGFNLCVGGGMGKIDNRDDSYPRLAEEVGFVDKTEASEVAEIIMGIQRDYGDRKDRHQARFKYTLDKMGLPWFLDILAERRGKKLQNSFPVKFTGSGDYIGWQKDELGLWHCTLHIQSGRVNAALRDQLAGLYQCYAGKIRLTTNQNLQLINIHDYDLEQIKTRLEDLGLSDLTNPTIQEAHSLSCVALPTCGLAMAESERYLPVFLKEFQNLKNKLNLNSTPINLRLTGCPNGCARPYLAEVALTGRAPGLYNLYLGGSQIGNRLAILYASNVNEQQIFLILENLLSSYSENRKQDEHFGDFLVRNKLLKVNAEKRN